LVDGALDALRAATSARPAADGDVIAGVPARYVATPSSTVDSAAVMRVAAEYDLAVVVRGAGTKRDWAMPPRRLDLIVETSGLAGVVEHAAGDLVVVVGAGTTREELADRLAPAGQQLALDTPLPGATIGGTVATGTSGPRRMLYGAARDLLIGVTVVRADGTVARAGGKVVKNVAGYDLGKLVAGSYGTLGLITECAFRLHPLPAAVAYVSRVLDGPAEAGRLAASVRGAQLVPSAVELDAPPGAPMTLTVLLEGTPSGVVRRSSALARLLGDPSVAEEPPPGWSAYPWRDGEVGLKLTAPLSAVPRVVAAVRRHGLALRGSAGSGVLYAGLPGPAEPDAVAAMVAELRGVAEHVVVLTAPAPVRDRVDLWGPVDGLELMRRVKRQFDPEARLAPGRFVGGI
jgi:glycolate oxidase FAD binding subunit